MSQLQLYKEVINNWPQPDKPFSSHFLNPASNLDGRKSLLCPVFVFLDVNIPIWIHQLVVFYVVHCMHYMLLDVVHQFQQFKLIVAVQLYSPVLTPTAFPKPVQYRSCQWFNFIIVTCSLINDLKSTESLIVFITHCTLMKCTYVDYDNMCSLWIYGLVYITQLLYTALHSTDQ